MLVKKCPMLEGRRCKRYFLTLEYKTAISLSRSDMPVPFMYMALIYSYLSVKPLK